MKDLKSKRVKIIVGEFDEERASEVMCQAYRLNMTAKEGYVWFLPTFRSDTLEVISFVHITNLIWSKSIVLLYTE